MLGILKKIGPSELVSNCYISNHNKVLRTRPKFKVSLFLYFCCFWINVTQINFENIKKKIQRIISDSCFQLKSRFNFDARAPSIPLLNFPFKGGLMRKIRFLFKIASLIWLYARIDSKSNSNLYFIHKICLWIMDGFWYNVLWFANFLSYLSRTLTWLKSIHSLTISTPRMGNMLWSSRT